MFSHVVLGVCLLCLPEPYASCGPFSYKLVSQAARDFNSFEYDYFLLYPFLWFYSTWVQSLCKRVLVIIQALFKYSICFVDATVEVTTLIENMISLDRSFLGQIISLGRSFLGQIILRFILV